MAYSNAIFYINLTSGSDAARTALTSCVASNPSGSTVRINKTSHGLVTGAIVDLTSFDSYLNGAWKITVVDANNFDLDTAVWSITTVDNNGTVTPRGGSSWSDGWATISSGPTAARTQIGDTIRISKTSDPTSLGSGTWTNLSKTITLASPAPVQIIDLVESAFTVANGATSMTLSTSTCKQGSLAAGVNKASPTATNTLYGYRNLGTTLNLSAYDAITFWAYGNFQFGADTWRVCLCSDTAGATIVDSFVLPVIPYQSWVPLVLTRTGGGNLGSAIQSIALYTATTAPNGGVGPYIDDVLACNTGSLNLASLVSKNPAAYDGINEAWYSIQSISGSTIIIDTVVSTPVSAGRGYFGATETATTYFRNTFQQGMNNNNSTTTINFINRAGTATYPIVYSGGWNTSTNIQDGETVFSSNGLGVGIYLSGINNVSFERISLCRFYDGYQASTSNNNTFSIPNIISCTQYGFNDNSSSNNITITNAVGNSAGIKASSSEKYVCQRIENSNTSGVVISSPTSNVFLSASSVSNNASYGIASSGANNTAVISSIASNGIAGIQNSQGDIYLFNSVMTGTEFASATSYLNGKVFSTNHDQSGYAYIYTDGGVINSQATTFQSGSGAEWRLNINSSIRNNLYPLKLPVAQYAVASGSLLIVSASMKKSHATDVNGRLVIPGGQLFGVPTDVVSTLANNSNEQILQVSCTPTMSGVIGIEVWAEYVNNNGVVYIDEISASV